ncbi:uncharacterized protein LOC123680868 [Harmonia axyridis]|uniref:uncharacterized protein LOC123680868 n=1 Tax=Harmonia axyridis TaxID=115357 RepID=UPI001E27721F|nr:uncharacterized protein LOC123680868 [Harmonia axyridis]
MIHTQPSKEIVQVIKELHRPARKNFSRRRTIIKGLDDLWQMDLGQLDKLATSNEGFKYILVVIDCFSKFVWARAVRRKTGEEVTRAFLDILQHNDGQIPINLQSDQGKEFFNHQFQELVIRKHHINHYNTYSDKKAAIVERVIRTLKEALFKQFSLRGTYRWIDILQDVVNAYNNKRHRTIRMKPCDVNTKNESDIYEFAYNHIKIAGPHRFQKGNIVRISKYRHVFTKGYLPQWTTELFKITKVQLTNPVSYLLEDFTGRPISGAFYQEELQKTKQPDVYLVEKVLRRRADKVLVRWLGMSEEHDSWIQSENKL